VTADEVSISIRGQEFPPGSWEHSIAERIIEATATRFGMTSKWNRTLHAQLAADLGGTVKFADGSLTLSPTHIFAPLRRIYEGGPFTPDELSDAAYAVVYATHEAGHTCSEFGVREYKDEYFPVTDLMDEDVVLEEGLADVVGHGIKADVFRALDLDRLAPELDNERTIVSYPTYYKAVLAMTKRFREWTDQGAVSFIGALKDASIGARFNAAADMVIAAQIGKVDQADRYNVRRDLRLPLQRALRQVRSVTADKNIGADEKLRRAPDLVLAAADEIEAAVARHTTTAAVAPPDLGLGRLHGVLNTGGPRAASATTAATAAVAARGHRPEQRNIGVDRP
jgi:hypothetical protein